MLVTLVTVHVSCELIKAIGLLIVKQARLFLAQQVLLTKGYYKLN